MTSKAVVSLPSQHQQEEETSSPVVTSPIIHDMTTRTTSRDTSVADSLAAAPPLPASSSFASSLEAEDDLQQQVLPTVSQEEESSSSDSDAESKSTVETESSSKKREREMQSGSTSINDKQLKMAPTATSSSSGRRRSPRKHRRQGETSDDAEARLALETVAMEPVQETTTTTPTSTTTPRKPLFSKLLSPHQQAAIFSPAVRTPLQKKQRRQSLMGKQASHQLPSSSTTPSSASPSKQLPTTAPSSVLKQPKYSGVAAAAGVEETATNIDTSYNIATNLAQTMEDVVNTESNGSDIMETVVAEKTVEKQQLPSAAPTTLLQSVSSNTPTTIDLEALQYRLSILFPSEKYPQLQYKPCILPRLVACYTLHKDYQEEMQLSSCQSGGSMDISTTTQPTPMKRTTRRRKRSMDAKSHSIQHLKPIRDFLNALVDLEWNLLEGNGSEDGASTSHSTKRVHFAAFDGSSLCPPSDVEENSHQQQEICVKDLVKVLELVDSMGGSLDGEIPNILQDMVSYLDNDFRLYYHDKTCARSVLSTSNTTKSFYPTRRVEKAASIYSRDLESILEKWNLQGGGNPTIAPMDPVFLTWQCRLADVAAQLVRFWLRTVMNPIPCRAEMKNKTQRWQDRFVDIVDLTKNSSSAFLLPDGASTKVDEGEMSAAIEDGSLSSILSDALSHIYDYLGGIPLGDENANSSKSELWRQRLLEVLPTEACCSSDRCHMGIGTGRKPAPPLSDEEWKQVGDELQVASDFFAFYHRVLFLEQLVEILLQAGDWATHWEATVQSAAQHLVVLHQSVQQSSSTTLKNDGADGSSLLPLIQQEDAHLVLLGLPLTELLQRIQGDILPLAKERYGILRKSYQTTAAAFKLGKSNTQHKKKYQPQVGELEDYWNDLFAGTVFPSVAMAAEKDE